MSETDWTRVRHIPKYDDPMETGRRSASGKLLWRCKKCGRETTGAERECYTILMQSIEAQIAGLRSLEDNWDSYGSPKPTEEAIARAEEILNTTPHAVPRHCGGVQLEWPNGFELSITAEGTQELE